MAKSSAFFRKASLNAPGLLLRLQRGYELIARHANAPVVPVWLDQLWGSIFSFQGGTIFHEIAEANSLSRHDRVWQTAQAEAADIATVREELLKLGEFCYSRRPVIRSTSRRSMRARTEAQTVCDRSDRWN